jgi:hypothetical protein
MTTTLPRVRFSEELTDSRTELAKEASSMLGYDKLAKAIVMSGALMHTLRMLEIQPLVQSSVTRYQLQKATPGTWSGHREGVAWLLLWAIIVLAVIPEIMPFTGKDFEPGLPGISVIILCVGSIPIFIRSMFLFWDKDARGHRLTRTWESVPLNQYHGNVPEFALSKAVQIKRALPACSIGVEYLAESEKKIVRPLRDPFLFVSLGDEKHYIDVWDEKEYESKL